MSRVIFISHPEVVIDPAIAVPSWHLSNSGIAAMRRFAEHDAVEQIGEVWASTETKAIEAAGILAARFGLGLSVDRGIDENDRSATGFLPPSEFQRMADAFFATPETSVRGWERAIDAQRRVVSSFVRITAAMPSHDIAIVGHGGTGTLLYCHLAGMTIDRCHDQPAQGHFWRYDLAGQQMLHGWRAMNGE